MTLHNQLKIDKKGVLFTFTAIALSIVIILSFKAYKPFEMKEKADVISVRVNTMNNFIKDVEQDLENGLFISSFRVFLSMVEYISNNGEYIPNIEEAFNELVLNGTLNNEELDLMVQSTFTDWIEKIEIQADKVGILVNFTILNVKINQTDAWSIFIEADINMALEDKKKTSSWNRNKSIITIVSIENFEDPLYIVNSVGRVTNPIVKGPTKDFVDGNDMTNFVVHLNNSYYIESNSSPNFLNRLQGILSNSSAGIESMVNLQKFQDQGLPIEDRSAIDYIYFGSQVTVNKRINNTPTWFKLDNDHLEVYEVQNMTI